MSDLPPEDMTPEEKLLAGIFGERGSFALPDLARAIEPDATPPKLTDAAKEQVKLRATYFNQLGVALFAVGGLAPMVKATTDDGLSAGTVSTIVVLSIVCFVLSGVLHYRATEHLKELDR